MTIPFKPRTGSLGSSKRACKYGPRDADGFCPKKPAGARSAKGKPPCKYGPRDANGYCPKKPSSYRSAKTPKQRAAAYAVREAGTIGGKAAVAAVDVALNPKARSMVKELALIPVSLIPQMTKAARAGVVGAILAAGVASYAITKYIIDRRAATKAQRADLAFKAAQQYREARTALAQIQGSPLTAAQLRQLADQFKAALLSLGLSTSDLKGL